MIASTPNLFPPILATLGEPLPPFIDFMTSGLGFIIITTLYFVPTLVALNKKYLMGIFIINLTLGWTILGWIGSLVWAVSSPKNEVK
jgi:hypothetical protein